MEEAEVPAAVEQDISESVPDFAVQSIVLEGEGDFCRAYTVNDKWIFRFAYNSEGSVSLEREIALLPTLAPAIGLPIPAIAYSGRQRHNGFAFVGYPKIGGVELTGERLYALDRSEQARCARDLGGFLHDLHSFDLGLAREAAVPSCGYPFCRTEEGVIVGSAIDIYGRELSRLITYPEIDVQRRSYCEAIVAQLLDERAEGEMAAALIHGDLSQDHVMFDPEERRIIGVIDFSDAIISTPLLDFMYLLHAYGESFLRAVLIQYPVDRPQEVITRVTLLHRWYIALRLLWALDYGYPRGIEAGLRQLDTMRSTA